MKTNNILYSVSSLALLSAIQPTESFAEEKRPNVLILIADDCSYHDIGCFGSPNHSTPNIDKLAQDGIKFNNAFNSNTMSAPTRMSLYTGMYSMKHGGYPNGTETHVKEDTRSLPHYLGDLGYRVGLTGKTHIRPAECFPFEEVDGFRKNCNGENNTYTLDGVTEFVSRDAEEPFCLVVASINPHAPWVGKPRNPNTYNPNELVLPPHWVDTQVTREEYVNYLHEIDLLDQEVGDVVQVLKDENQYDNTLIIFVSEQGTKTAGAKWTVWNPGTKSAMVAYWNGKIVAGRETSALVQYEDIVPTLIDIAGGTISAEIDGKSMKNLLLNETDKHLDYVFSVHNNIPAGDDSYPMRSVSDGKYKLIWNLLPHIKYEVIANRNANYLKSWREVDSDFARFIVDRYEFRPEFEFYDIENDVFELNNLAKEPEHAGRIASLKSVLNTWMEAMGDKGAVMDSPFAPGKPVVDANLNEDFSSQRWINAFNSIKSLPGPGQNISIAEENINGYNVNGSVLQLDTELQKSYCETGGTSGHKYAFRINNSVGSFFEFPIVKNAGKITLHARNGNNNNYDDITIDEYDTIRYEWKTIKTLRIRGNSSYASLDEVISYDINSETPIKLRINHGNRYVALYKVVLEPYGGSVPDVSEKLGAFDLPTGTAAFNASGINSHIQISDLTYTANLGYDYNTSKGYYRPYNWSTSAIDPEKYVEFVITPNENVEVTIEKIRIEHKPNNPTTLGPVNTKIAYSTDNKKTFTFSDELFFNPDESNDKLTTSIVKIADLHSMDPIAFRLYAYNSRHGTAEQFDYWIINNIEVYGSAENQNLTLNKKVTGNTPICYFSQNNLLHVQNITERTLLTVFDPLGNILIKKELINDEYIYINSSENVLIINFEFATGNKSIKILR